jgi:hypothetical protein
VKGIAKCNTVFVKLQRLYDVNNLITLFNFGLLKPAVCNIENYPAFRQALQLPSSGLMCSGWELFGDRRRPDGRDGVHWRNGQLSSRKGKEVIKEPLHIYPEDDTCNVCRNVGQFLTYDASHTRKPELNVSKLGPGRPSAQLSIERRKRM